MPHEETVEQRGSFHLLGRQASSGNVGADVKVVHQPVELRVCVHPDDDVVVAVHRQDAVEVLQHLREDLGRDPHMGKLGCNEEHGTAMSRCELCG